MSTSNTPSTPVNDNTRRIKLQVRIPEQIDHAVNVRAARLKVNKNEAVAAALSEWAAPELAEVRGNALGAAR